jgi:hypothetical protein
VTGSGPWRVRGQRRRAAELAALAHQSARQASLHRQRLGSAVQARVATKESLALGLVAGLTVGMLSSRRSQRPTRVKPKGTAGTLVRRQLTRMVTTFAMSRLVAMLSEPNA